MTMNIFPEKLKRAYLELIKLNTRLYKAPMKFFERIFEGRQYQIYVMFFNRLFSNDDFLISRDNEATAIAAIAAPLNRGCF